MNGLQEVAKTIEELPVYLFQVVCGLLVAILSNPPMTVLALGAVAGSVVFNVWGVLGITAVVYVVVFALNNLANAIGNSNASIARSILTYSQTRAQPPTQTPSDDL